MVGSNAPIQVVKMELFQAGTYNPQYRRPIVMNVNLSDCSAFSEATQNGTQFTPGRISKIVNNIVGISATPERNAHTTDGSVPIVNEWSNERCRFTLELLETLTATSRTRHFYIGYTDAVGFSQQGTRDALIDRRMQFYVNAVVSVIETDVWQSGALTTITRVSRSDTYLTGQWAPNVHMGFNDYSCRPQEVVDHMRAGVIINQAGIQAPINNTGATFSTMKVKTSLAANSRPTQYLTNILECYTKASAEQEGGYLDEQVLFENASGYGTESLLSHEPLFRIISIDPVMQYGFFTFGQLEAGAPHLDQITDVHQYDGSGMFGAAQAGTTEFMHNATMETHITSMINTSLPSLLMESLFRSMHIHVSNNNVTATPFCELVPQPILPGENMPRPSYTTLSANMDVGFWWSRFRQRFLDEVFNVITQNNINIVDMVINISITGDILVSCSVNGSPLTDYRNPCFCNQLTSSLTTNNPGMVDGIANDIFSLTNHAANVLGEAMTNSPFAPANPFEAQAVPLYTPSKHGALSAPVKTSSRWD